MRLEFLADRRTALSVGVGLVAGLSSLVAGRIDFGFKPLHDIRPPGDGGNPVAVSLLPFDEEVLS